MSSRASSSSEDVWTAAVIEVGVGGPDQMKSPARVIKPDLAIILNVKRTHTTAFRDLNQHATEKEILLNYLTKDGIALLNADDSRVRAMAPSKKRVLFGSSGAFRAENISFNWPSGLSFTLRGDSFSESVQTRLNGSHWQTSALAALSAAVTLGLSPSRASEAISHAVPFPGRLSLHQLPSGAEILRDDYNASVDSLEATLQVLEEITGRNKILVLTDFSDFGKNRKQRLKYLAERIAGTVDELVLIGEISEYGRRRALEQGFTEDSVHAFKAIQEAAEFVARQIGPGDLVLVKGRTTDHAARIPLSFVEAVQCWKQYCPKRILCDFCWELTSD